jgi:hypothetical protein
MRLLLALLLFSGVTAARQTNYVFVKPGSKLYHQASCEQLAGAKGVTGMTRSQAEARGFTQDPACDPAKHPPDEKKKPEVVYVYVQPDGKYYHREHCAKAGASPKRMKLDDAAKKYWPCPVCKPPIRKRGGAAPAA